jgi:hypothetical protein
MKPRALHLYLTGVLLGLALAAKPALAVTTNIFSTQFEAAEGYSITNDLAGQNDWQQFGSGGNGLVSGSFLGSGQQAYLGFTPPNPGDDQLFLWKPVNYSPIASNTPIVVFSVLIGFVDSTTNYFDDFDWMVFNTDADQLFTINFRNDELLIYYALDGTNTYVSTGKTFTHEVAYQLVITMNFASNLWSATLDGATLVTNQAITTTGATLDLGDVDAVWRIWTDPPRPGDNYMLFDNYRITAQLPPSAPHLDLIERTSAGHVILRLEGTSGARFAIDGTADFSSWTPLRTNTVSDGFFDYVDTTASAISGRFYRARLVP